MLTCRSFPVWEMTGQGMVSGEGEVRKLEEGPLDLIEDDLQSREKGTQYFKKGK